jgi:predicted PurR-regulated permease PerM
LRKLNQLANAINALNQNINALNQNINALNQNMNTRFDAMKQRLNTIQQRLGITNQQTTQTVNGNERSKSTSNWQSLSLFGNFFGFYRWTSALQWIFKRFFFLFLSSSTSSEFTEITKWIG